METHVHTACVVTDLLERTVVLTLTIALPTHVSTEHALIWLMTTTVPVRLDLLEQTVVLTLTIVLLSHVSMEHVLI